MNWSNILRLLFIGLLCTLTISSTYVASENVPSESECRPYIEKALNTIKADIKEPSSAEITVDIDDDSKENANDEHITISIDTTDGDDDDDDNTEPSVSDEKNDDEDSKESVNENDSKEDAEANDNDLSTEDSNTEKEVEGEDTANSGEDGQPDDQQSVEEDQESKENSAEVDTKTDNQNSTEEDNDQSTEQPTEDEDSKEQAEQDGNDDQSKEDKQVDDDSKEEEVDEKSVEAESKEEIEEKPVEAESKEDLEAKPTDDESQEDTEDNTPTSNEKDSDSEEKEAEADADGDSKENDDGDDDDDDKKDDSEEDKSSNNDTEESHEISAKSFPVDDLLLEAGIPENLRDRSHIDEILRLNEDAVAQNEALEKIADHTLKELKRVYENAIKPLETLYKYRDLSNRHFGDSEIFSKPLVLLMGPWSGGKSSIVNYLTDNEYTDFSLKTGAEPSLPYFNILMHGETEQVLDGTQLAADWTFSGLQKFGQGLQDRLRGLKLPSKLLKKVNIVEIPGILEVRKHVSRIFPFNDACQWFIDRADIIFLVYDPSKLDVGPETEAILDQLKGREYQTRIVLNKADQVHPEELLRVQGALIWNISPLMSSQQPPVMYTVSLWSHPFEENTPVRLLQAQEKALLQDLSQAIDHRIENKIASARRFAVRVRNHAKMVDCYLTTYYNHKTLFGNKKKISGEIVAHPQNYHIYEGLSTLTNISRYDLPDPEVYRDFFQLNPLYEFKKLSETCTYFRGCPINKLDVAIAYDLPELVNRYKRAVGQALNTLELSNGNNDSSTDRR